jgi:hypothetical protein
MRCADDTGSGSGWTSAEMDASWPAEFAFAGGAGLLENGVRKLLLFFVLWLGVVLWVPAETFSLTDGTTVSGDIVKVDDNGMVLRTAGDSYANLQWQQLSQDSLKQLAANPKVRPLVEPFIEPDVKQRAGKEEIQINPVKRMERPENPSLFGGFFHAPLGLLLLLAVYLANLYAAYEVSIIRARPAAQVIGLSAVLPFIGPVIFLIMPIKVEPEPLEQPVPVSSQAPASFSKPKEEVQVVEASSRGDVRKAPAQVFARGKFTFNKRFLETKFAGYIGEPKGDALNHTMSVKCGQGEFSVLRIAQVGATDVIFETVESGPVTVSLPDIQEIKLNPKTA